MQKEAYNNNIYDNIRKFGYHEIKSYDFSCESYKLLYEEFDEIVRLIKNDSKFIEYNKIIESSFAVSETKSPNCNDYIIGFNYIKPKANRTNIKVYFHFSEEYFVHIQKNYMYILIEYPIFNNFLKKLYNLFFISCKYFDNTINELAKKLPNLKDVMYVNKKDLIIYVKICVHEPDESVAERTHNDFSGFTLLLHNDDIDKHHLHVASNTKNSELKYKVYNKKYKKIENQKYSLPIIFPGSALQKISIELDPTPHYVSQLSKTRHSMIAFCMVPNVMCKFTEPFKYE